MAVVRKSEWSTQGYTPDANRLPAFLLHLARDVEWDEEKPCFRTLASTLAQFYSLQESLDAVQREHAKAALKRRSSSAQQTGRAPAAADAPTNATSAGTASAPPVAGAQGAETPQVAPGSNGSMMPDTHEATGGEDAVEAALAAQRPHPNLSASGPVGDVVVAEAVDELTGTGSGDDAAALQPEVAAESEKSAAGQAADADGQVPMDIAADRAVKAAGAEDDATPNDDSLRAAVGLHEAEDERAWTIQHVRCCRMFS